MRGCLWFLFALLLIGGIFAGLLFRIPQKLGIVPSAAERVFSQTPDREGAKTMLAEAKTAGLNTQGIVLYVFPIGDGSESVAVATLDARQGFTFGETGEADPIANVMIKLMSGPSVRELGVRRLGISYISPEGSTYMSFTASSEVIASMAAGRMTLAQFMDAVDGDINFPAMIKHDIDSFKNL